ncbi:MAG TPA: nucleotide exchange factor GrpE [Vicinamibacteria bacterium]
MSRGNGSDEDLPVVTTAPEPAGAPGPEEGSDAGGASEAGLVESPPSDETEALRRERDELRDALLRRRAEFENYRRRVERDRSAAATEAEAAILRAVLGTVDNLERALAASGADSALREGVELTLRELTALLDSLGVVAVSPLRQRFDPTLHQAIVHEAVPGFDAGTVGEVYRKGYTFKERLLRPALVKVSSGEDEGGGEEGGPGLEERGAEE